MGIKRAIDTRKEHIATYTELKKGYKKAGDSKGAEDCDRRIKIIRGQIKSLEKEMGGK
jgi:hypothetical protein